MRPRHVAPAALLLLAGCESFHELGTAPRDAAAESASSDARRGDVSSQDAGPPLGDFVCDAPWTAPAATADPRCAGVRTVMLIDTGTVTLGGVTIARTVAGRIGIAYDDQVAVDSQGLRLARFIAPGSPDAGLDASIAAIGFGPSSRVGVPSSVAAGGDADALSVAYVDQSEEQLLYAQLVDGGAPTPSELVATGVGEGSYVSLAVSTTGDVRAAYFVPSTGAIRSAERGAGGGFDAPSEVVTGLASSSPGVGASSLVFDADGTPNVLYQASVTSDESEPEYATLASAWSLPETIDNNVLDGLSGFSPSLAVHGPDKYAAYFYVPAGQSTAPTAELHVAHWRLRTDMPDITVVDSVIPATDPGGTTEVFRFAASLAVDGYGLLHLAVVRPEAADGAATVEYVRQAVVDGGVTWLTDVIDMDVLGDPSALAPNAFASIVVDDAARPHIAYRSGNDGNLYYATRFDR